MMYFRRLSELNTINEIFDEYLKSGDQNIDNFRDKIANFSFGKDSVDLVNRDSMSKMRISKILNKAVEAIKSGKYWYVEGKWYEKKQDK